MARIEIGMEKGRSQARSGWHDNKGKQQSSKTIQTSAASSARSKNRAKHATSAKEGSLFSLVHLALFFFLYIIR